MPNGNPRSRFLARVERIAAELGLKVQRDQDAGRRKWFKPRKLHFVIRGGPTDRVLWVDCRRQDSPGTTEEKIAAILWDMEDWPMNGIIVTEGVGWHEDFAQFMKSNDSIVDINELEFYLREYFEL